MRKLVLLSALLGSSQPSLDAIAQPYPGLGSEICSAADVRRLKEARAFCEDVSNVERVIERQAWVPVAATPAEAVWETVLVPLYQQNPRSRRAVRRWALAIGVEQDEAASLISFARSGVEIWRSAWANYIQEQACSESEAFESGEALGRVLNEVKRLREVEKAAIVNDLWKVLDEEAAAQVVRYAMRNDVVVYTLDLETYYAGWSPSEVREAAEFTCIYVARSLRNEMPR